METKKVSTFQSVINIITLILTALAFTYCIFDMFYGHRYRIYEKEEKQYYLHDKNRPK